MSKHTAWWMILLVAVLGLLVFQQLQGEDPAAEQGDRPLLVGLDIGSVTSIRIDNLERGLQMLLEQQSDGGWRITDPLDYPAEPAAMSLLADILTTNRAEPYLEDSTLEQLSLSPPRVVVEIQEVGGRLRRLEVGGHDLDGQHVLVRVDGEVLRTLRNLDTTLERDLFAWRDRAIVSVSPRGVVELRRRGEITLREGLEPSDLTLDALQDGGWRATAPFGVQLDPGGMGALVQSAAQLRAAGFVHDAPTDLAHYGLDPPEITIELTTLKNETVVLRFARVEGSERWHCYREGHPHVFTVAPEQMFYLTQPTGILADRDFARVVRDRVAALRLAFGERRTRVERIGNAWRVTAREGDAELLSEVPADTERVADLLAVIEGARVLEYLPDETWPGPIPTPATGQGIFLEVDGADFGGFLGEAYTTRGGGGGRLFLRPGDSLVGLVDEELYDVLRTDPQDLRSTRLHRVKELAARQVHVSSGSRKTLFRQDDRGRWMPADSEVEARNFALMVDRILSVKAERFLDGAEDRTGRDPIAVSIVGDTGKALASFSVSVLQEEGTEAVGLYEGGGQRAQVSRQLHADLAALFE